MMTNLPFVLLTSALLAGSAVAVTEVDCKVDVTNVAMTIANNATYLNTCSPGSKWKLKNIFEAENLTNSEFLIFCNVSTCMDPMHALFDKVPEECIGTYTGDDGYAFGDALGMFYGKCHQAVREIDGSRADFAYMNYMKNLRWSNMSMGKDVVPSPTPTPTPTKKSAAISVTATQATAAIAMTIMIAALVL